MSAIFAAAVLLLGLTGKGPVGARAGGPDELLSGARSGSIRLLETRCAASRDWAIPSPETWASRTFVSREQLPKGRRVQLARELADSCLAPRLQPPDSEWFGPADLDFLVIATGPDGTQQFLLSFPELEVRWLDTDSTVHIASFERCAIRIAKILMPCFPRDSTVLDLQAEVGWVERSRHAAARNDVGADEYVFVPEGMPGVMNKAPCPVPVPPRPTGVDASLLVQVLLDRRGTVRCARVKRSTPMLDETAIACVRRWTFRPGDFEGNPIGFRVAVPVKYSF